MYRPLVLLNALKLHQGPERLPTGNFQHVLHLATELSRCPEFDVRLLTDLDSHGPLAERIDAEQLVPTPLRGNSIVAADRAVVQAVRRLQPAIYHRPTGQLPFFKLPCRAVTGVADLGFMVLPHPLLKRLYKELSYRWTMYQADCVVCVSQFTRADVARRLGVPDEKLRVIPHGANQLPPPDTRLADQVGGPFFVVFAHQTHKNAELCLRALGALRTEMPSLRLAVIGKNAFVERTLKPLAAQAGVGTMARFMGVPTSAELAGLYRRAVGLLFPSRFEGFGLPVLEAMNMDCPVVCSNVCSLPEVAGDAAVQLAPDNLDGMKAAMRRLILDSRWREERIAAGRLQAAKFTWRRAAELTIAIYQELLPISG